jgi:cellulose synthase/poly-beta-1,6-N-acetylglucosamine synthase-like glycosyltransferase
MELAAVVFVSASALILYILFGYPLLLALWPARRRHLEYRSSTGPRTVTIILPVRNGARWLRNKLESLFALDYPQEKVQLIVVSDSSTDDTETIAREYSGRLLLLRSPGQGKAEAINHALEFATGEILFMTDVRQAIDRRALRLLIELFDDPSVGVVSGELVIRSGSSLEEENVGLYWRYEKWIRTRHSEIDSVIGATGAIYAMRRNLAAQMPPGTLLDDVHLPLQAFFQGYRVLLLPGAHAYDSPTALDAEFRRKVRTLAGVYQLMGAFPQLLGPRNRMCFHFWSHKLGRLLLPFLLLAVAGSSLFLPSPHREITLAAQAAFYLIAALDRWIPESNPFKKISSVTRTFVVLMCAALVAVSILFRPSEAFSKTPGPKNSTAQTSA